MKAKLIEKFVSIYGEGGEIRSFFSPGRVNLIGEHTDYNGGHVFPCALSIGTYMIVRKREDRTIRFYSENFSKLGVIETSLDDLVYSEKAGWTNYPKGVMWAMEGRGYKIPTGMDILIYGTIPNGSGLSSSASLEVLTGLAVRDLFGFEGISMIDLALIGQYSENNFNGCYCQCCNTAFQSCDSLFEYILCRVCQSSVDVTGICQTKSCSCMIAVTEYIRRSLINRNCPCIGDRVWSFLTYVKL